jgi:hypothetical protein
MAKSKVSDRDKNRRVKEKARDSWYYHNAYEKPIKEEKPKDYLPK